LKNSDAKGFVTLDALFEKYLTRIHSTFPELKLVATASVGGFLPAVKRFLGKLLGKIPKGENWNRSSEKENSSRPTA